MRKLLPQVSGTKMSVFLWVGALVGLAFVDHCSAAAGRTGDPGLTGYVGPPGSPGATGDTGLDGDGGEQGEAGETGATGRTGLPGPIGADGPTGAKGASGPPGAAGRTGPAGVTGLSTVYADECASFNGGCDQLCLSSPVAGHFCACSPGYELLQPNVSACEGGAVLCDHTPAGRYCACSYGSHSRPLNGTSCADVDECRTDNGGCDQLCINAQGGGGRSCGCSAGYRLVAGTHCADVDECQVAGGGGCSDGCVNVPGGYYCTCPEGEDLQSDSRRCDGTIRCVYDFKSNAWCYCVDADLVWPMNGSTCAIRNECSYLNGGCEQTCADAATGNACACRVGYKLARNGYECSDVNECLDAESCAPTAMCLNSAGSYLCLDLGGGAKSAELGIEASSELTHRSSHLHWPFIAPAAAIAVLLVAILPVSLRRRDRLRSPSAAASEHAAETMS